jgi:hypothetical protein
MPSINKYGNTLTLLDISMKGRKSWIWTGSFARTMMRLKA